MARQKGGVSLTGGVELGSAGELLGELLGDGSREGVSDHVHVPDGGAERGVGRLLVASVSRFYETADAGG